MDGVNGYALNPIGRLQPTLSGSTAGEDISISLDSLLSGLVVGSLWPPRECDGPQRPGTQALLARWFLAVPLSPSRNEASWSASPSFPFTASAMNKGRLALEFRSLAALSTAILNIGIIKPCQELLLHLSGFVSVILVDVDPRAQHGPASCADARVSWVLSPLALAPPAEKAAAFAALGADVGVTGGAICATALASALLDRPPPHADPLQRGRRQ